MFDSIPKLLFHPFLLMHSLAEDVLVDLSIRKAIPQIHDFSYRDLVLFWIVCTKCLCAVSLIVLILNLNVHSHKPIVIIRSSSKLVTGLALLACTAYIFERDSRTLAHRAENAVLRVKNLGCVKLGDITIVHHTDTIIRDDSAQPIYNKFQLFCHKKKWGRTNGRYIGWYDHETRLRSFLESYDPCRNLQTPSPRPR
jgi:hypothetical protein